MIRTRFAPSPTGALHAGTVRTALFAWLAAKCNGGKFILRIEDTDRSREVAGATQNILDSLAYLGIGWDEGPDKAGPHGPYVQSQRLDIYKKWAKVLIDGGRAYADSHTPAQLEELRAKAKASHQPFLFRNHRPSNSADWDGSTPLRFKSEPKPYHWHDEVMGDIATGPEVIDDFILLKSDGFPTYNFAHIIDDHLMEVTLVTRSQEFIPSMPNYLNLYEALGFEPPQFAHLPMVLGSEGNQKLSKRRGAKQLLEYKKEGFLAEALMNYLALIGWNDGSQQEIFSKQELIDKFDLSRVQKSPARFDESRLEWMNGHYIRELPIDRLAQESQNFWPKEAKNADPEYKTKVLELVKERLKYIAELPGLTAFFFSEPKITQALDLLKHPVDQGLKRLRLEDIQNYLRSAHQELSNCDFSEEDLAEKLNSLLTQLGTKPGVLFAAIRVAITGAAVSPQLFGTLAVLGKQISLRRIQNTIDHLSN